nr:AAA family ATPase [Pantoea ananatis]
MIIENEIENIDDNIFTVITGKNGVGKSRLLSAISFHFIPEQTVKRAMSYLREPIDRNYCTLEFDNLPHKVITVSTSPFDKFPLPRRREMISNYSYLGLRGLSSIDLGAEYISKITFKLISAVMQNELDMARIANVLNYLGYYDQIEILVTARYSTSKVEEILKSGNSYQAFENRFLGGGVPATPLTRSVFITENGHINKQAVEYALDAMMSTANNRTGTFGKIIIDKNGASLISDTSHLDEKFMFLLESGLLSIRNIQLHKKNSKQKFSIKNASSGEQCILMSFLGIASQIADNCVICIDEPEVCLHPEWQERYISMLIDTFKDYKKCHFIIATHSPQITSKLNSDNCFVVGLQDQKIHNASSVNNRSIDFQLAMVFKSPGYKNEYLTRELINFLSELTTENIIPDEKFKEIKRILTLKPFLDESDPVKKLLILAEKSIRELNK